MFITSGFEVTGVFMKNWDTVNEFGECQAEKDFADAEWACKTLDIPLLRVDFVKEYWTNVFRLCTLKNLILIT